jgi:hypothetical protein
MPFASVATGSEDNKMNTVMTTERSRHEHPPQRVEVHHHHEVRRVGLLDRVALHLGVALVKWGRRPLLVETRERRANRVERRLAVLERELAAERMRYLNVPRQ